MPMNGLMAVFTAKLKLLCRVNSMMTNVWRWSVTLCHRKLASVMPTNLRFTIRKRPLPVANSRMPISCSQSVSVTVLSVTLSKYFKRANGKEPERGGTKKVRFGETPTERKGHLVAQRERWADLQNKHLERYQHTDRVDARSLKAQGVDREPERHLGAGQVQRFDTEQLQAILERREAERQVQQSRDERDRVIDVTTSLREALSERDSLTAKPERRPELEQEAASGRTFSFGNDSEKLNALVSDAMKDIQDEIDLQSLVNNAMAEFQGIHQEMERQKEREQLAEKPRQQEKKRQQLAEQKRQKPDKGWSFSR